MNSFPIRDINNRVVGRISLENDELPKALINGIKYRLEGTYDINKKFHSFLIVPDALPEERR